ncbi:glutathione ABC transporter substrate-binding protein [uncultured Ilyobacter sp.]|uniref:glutathione ABC transporter substrate-binding protein n=1 Tax=uncultured Ilyobacter sp. TaxID=544433 RepID=UPI002AA66E3A|nr:glutathione ABC transporter substrate-binding protein [uncultured Ilyobacter sp.]
MLNKIKLLLIAITAMILLVACGEKSEEGSKVKKDTLTVAQPADAKALDPHATNDQPSARVMTQIYDRLAEIDNDMNIIPGLAESWEQPDSFTTIFNLRHGIKFHNGEELKASDVKFSLERELKTATVSHIVEGIDKVEVLDDYTVKVTTTDPCGAILYNLAHPASSILNEKSVTKSGKNYGQEPIGTGPYKFVSWDAGDKITLEANSEYFNETPAIKNLVFRNIVEGSNRVIGLETGEIDIAYDIEPIDSERVATHDDLKFTQQEAPSLDYIGFNMKKKPFDNKKVRQAIATAVNVDDLIEAVLMGAGTKANSPIGPKVFGYNPNAKAYKFNVEKAKQLLTEAGYPSGFETVIWTNDNPIRMQVCQIVQAQLKEIGIEMRIEPMEWGAYLESTARGEHDMYILGWGTTTGDADYGLYALFHSSTQGGPGNRSFYKNPAVDNLLDKGKSSTNPEERKALYGEAQEIIQEDLPVLSLFYKNINAGMQNNVEGFVLHPSGSHRLVTAHFAE